MTWLPPEGMLGATKEKLDAAALRDATQTVLERRRAATIPCELPGGGRPNKNYRYGFQLGDTGWDVWAAQVALNSHQLTYKIAEDGWYGRQTEAAVKREQTNHHLAVVDGKLGPKTMAAIIKVEAFECEAVALTPPGLLLGVAQGESGLQFAAVGGPNWNNSYDAGVTQTNIVQSEIGLIGEWHAGFSVSTSLRNTGELLRSRYEGYKAKYPSDSAKTLWTSAILSYNWPAAADKRAAGTFDSWRYYAIGADGLGHYYGVDDLAHWVVQASGGRLQTARQWCEDYIATKSIYVTKWSI